ncbi:MAG: cupin domain-containing protein [Deltaproteobacteria bacterium]|nr:cupin domain-containing protein [Deltaproteobacteria bacterium]MBI3079507.1 cupin domain-containing protein [Deltaproteobacteria bacterium]
MGDPKFVRYGEQIRPPVRDLEPLIWKGRDIARELDKFDEVPEYYNGRRNLVLQHPALGDIPGTSQTMHVAFLHLKAGEHVPPHRHSYTTIIYVIRGRGHTIIDGKRLDWEPGDVYLIPAWADHEFHPEEDHLLVAVTDGPLFVYLRSLVVQEPGENAIRSAAAEEKQAALPIPPRAG